jgi:hypothetical protein
MEIYDNEDLPIPTVHTDENIELDDNLRDDEEI